MAPPFFAYVTGNDQGAALEHAALCKPRGLDGVTAGFPLPDWVPTRGIVRVAVRFMDFPDAQAEHTTEEEVALGLPWSRWQLGWLHSRQVDCVTDDTATVTLAPIARTGGAVAMAAVPIDSHRVIVVESRRKIGYDSDHIHTANNGATTRLPRLLEEGVLVYTVDTRLRSGQLPIKIAGDTGNGQVDSFPVLQEGESVTVHGYTVTVTADDGDTHTVSITRTD